MSKRLRREWNWKRRAVRVVLQACWVTLALGFAFNAYAAWSAWSHNPPQSVLHLFICTTTINAFHSLRDLMEKTGCQ